MKYRNPVIPGFNPDSSLCRVGQDYYLATSSFEFFPGVPLYHSRDLVNWRLVNHVLTRPSQLSFPNWRPSGGIFAPTLRHHQGTFYLVTTNMSGNRPSPINFMVTTQDPLGPWSEPVPLAQGGIDPSLFFDDDGKVYLSTAWFEGLPFPPELPEGHFPMGIQQCELDLTTGKPVGDAPVIWRGTGGRYPEGPHLFRRGEFYYLLIAEGGTEQNHAVTLARSTSPWRPWEACPHNPVLTHRGLYSPIQNLGHADLLEAHDGSWWAVCLGVRPQGMPPTAHLGRETFLLPVRWDSEGWPHFGLDAPVQVRLEMDGPEFMQEPQQGAGERDDFTHSALDLRWTYLGNPMQENYQVTPDGLRLSASPARLSDGPPVTWLGQRQTQFNCTVQTELDFLPQDDQDEAGLTVWMNPTHHYDLFVTRRNGERCLVTRRQVGSLVSETACHPLPDGPVTLRIEAEPTTYRLGMQTGSGEFRPLDTAAARYLAPEVAGGCTGVFFALYTIGHPQNPVSVSWFEQRSNE